MLNLAKHEDRHHGFNIHQVDAKLPVSLHRSVFWKVKSQNSSGRRIRWYSSRHFAVSLIIFFYLDVLMSFHFQSFGGVRM